MSSEEIKQIKETLKYYETTKTEPTYCEELITTGELKRIIEEIERLNNIIDKARAKIQNMFDNGNEETIIDDLLELDRILGSDKE